MKKYLVNIELRYNDAPKYEGRSQYQSKDITIGVYDTFVEACEHGNRLLERLESQFGVHTFTSGTKAKKERFSEHGGPFGTKNNLISSSSYLKTPFVFYARIKTLHYDSVDDAIQEALNALERWRKWDKSQEE